MCLEGLRPDGTEVSQPATTGGSARRPRVNGCHDGGTRLVTDRRVSARQHAAGPRPRLRIDEPSPVAIRSDATLSSWPGNGASNLELELGCGDHKRITGAVGIDVRAAPGVDIVGDVFDVLPQFDRASVTAIYSYHFLEHVEDIPSLLAECGRILVPGGLLHCVVPHFSSPYYYSDQTHRAPFGLYTFNYWVAEPWRSRRAVPRYADALPFQVEDVHYNFKSPRPFYGRYIIKRIFGSAVNSTRYTKELYEENLCWVFPAYEIGFRLRRLAES